LKVIGYLKNWPLTKAI